MKLRKTFKEVFRKVALKLIRTFSKDGLTQKERVVLQEQLMEKERAEAKVQIVGTAHTVSDKNIPYKRVDRDYPKRGLEIVDARTSEKRNYIMHLSDIAYRNNPQVHEHPLVLDYEEHGLMQGNDLKYGLAFTKAPLEIIVNAGHEEYERRLRLIDMRNTKDEHQYPIYTYMIV